MATRGISIVTLTIGRRTQGWEPLASYSWRPQALLGDHSLLRPTCWHHPWRRRPCTSGCCLWLLRAGASWDGQIGWRPKQGPHLGGQRGGHWNLGQLEGKERSQSERWWEAPRWWRLRCYGTKGRGGVEEAWIKWQGMKERERKETLTVKSHLKTHHPEPSSKVNVQNSSRLRPWKTCKLFLARVIGVICPFVHLFHRFCLSCPKQEDLTP